ncbi:MAG: hypothetical protein AB8B56_13200 [Crocinitomicaceae bacterium]
MRVITLRNLKFFLFQWIFLVSLLSCSQESALVVDQQSNREDEYRRIQHEFVELFNSEDSIVYEVKNVQLAPVKLTLVFEGERSVVSVGNKKSDIKFNYFYDSDIDSGLKRIRFFEAQKPNETLMLFPVTTEEFPTFSLVRFDTQGKFTRLGTHTYSFDDFEMVAEQIHVGNYALRKMDDIVRVVLQSTPEMLLSEVWMDEEEIDHVTDSEIEKRPIQSYFSDLDGDGREDKMIVYRNESLDYEFSKDHFGLNVEIYRGTENGFVLWTENDHVIFPFFDNCISEGFERIDISDNKITLYQQACRDYYILINAKTTFEVRNEQIILVEYQEEYFNKADHEEQIPSQNWTSSDFGTLKFEDINSELWRKLRGY